jgi:hypothetical protein
MAAVTNRSRLAIVKELVKGTTPATPAYKVLRQTANTLEAANSFIESEEITDDRKLADDLMVGRDVGGAISVEWAFDSHDDLIEGGMMSTWVKSAERNGTEITAASATAATSYTVTNGQTFAQYMLVRATGFAQAANNRTFVAATGSNATNIAAAAGGAAETPGTTARVKCIGLEGPTADIQAAAGGLTSTLVDFTVFNLSGGQWVYVGGLLAANQFAGFSPGYARISMATAITATGLPFDVLPAGWAVDAGAGKNIRVYFTDFIVDGVTENSYSIERNRGDIATFEVFKGALIDTFSLQGVADDKVNGEFTAVAFGYQATQVAGSTYKPASQAPVFNGASNVEFVAIGNTDVRTGVDVLLGLDLSVQNNARKDPGFGAFGGVSTSIGSARVGGGISLYLGSLTYTNISVNNQETALRFGLKDILGNGLVFDAPRVKLRLSPPGDEGLNVTVVTEGEWRALKYTPALAGLPTRQLAISQFETIGA